MKRLFPLNSVRLGEGVFYDAQQVGAKYLKQLDPDRLLAPCYIAAGRAPKAERYGGWEERSICGHSLGHWLSAVSAMYAACGDRELYERAVYAVDELAGIQDSDGYVGGVDKAALLRVFGGDFEAEAFSLAGVWVPWYSLHKIYAGLLDCYIYAGISKALDVVCGMLDFAARGILGMSSEAISRMLICEHGGMNEVFAIAYELTGKAEYLEAARKFCDMRVLEPLLCREDRLTGLHANTQLPKILGAERIACVSPADRDLSGCADFFLDTVLEHHSYAIGGHGNHEHFTLPDTEPLGMETCETCNSYNMLKLISRRFQRCGSAKLFDDYERILYNHILAAQEPETGMKCYFMSTKPGHFKVYSTPFDSFWCCVGTGMENPALYTRDIYAYDGDTLYINLFIPSCVDFDGSVIELSGEFPYSGRLRAAVKSGAAKRIAVRMPSWCDSGSITADRGYTVQDGYMLFDGSLSEGDAVEWYFPREAGIYHAKDDPDKISFFYGPILLAGAMGRENFPDTDFVPVHMSLHHHPCIDEVRLIKDEPMQLITLDAEAMVFELPKELTSDSKPMRLVPYFSLHHERYTLYWQLITRAEAQQHTDRSEYAVEDDVICGQQQSEIEHDYCGSCSESGYFEPAQASFREAFGGSFGYTLHAPCAGEYAIAVDFWGGDDDLWRDGTLYRREFALSANGVILSRGQSMYTGEEIKTRLYPLLLADKGTVSVELRAGNGCATARLFGIRLLRKN